MVAERRIVSARVRYTIFFSNSMISYFFASIVNSTDLLVVPPKAEAARSNRVGCAIAIRSCFGICAEVALFHPVAGSPSTALARPGRGSRPDLNLAFSKIRRSMRRSAGRPCFHSVGVNAPSRGQYSAPIWGQVSVPIDTPPPGGGSSRPPPRQEHGPEDQTTEPSPSLPASSSRRQLESVPA